jgi:TonB family protein
MKLLLVTVSVLWTSWLYAQQGSNSTSAPAPAVFNYVEQMPSAGYDLGAYLQENLHYPDTARKYNISGRVIIKFVVNEDGHISNCTVTKSIGGGCDEEALRVVKSFPRWRPGYQNGKAVKVYFTLPIVYTLTD